MIELRLLRYFIAVAETEHVGRAAKLLHVSQSPLSRQIRQLEEAISLTLFEREKQRLRLTLDGQWLLARARQVLAGVQALEQDAARRARGEVGALRLGFVKTAMWSAVLPRALQRFRAKHPDVAIELKNRRSAVQIGAIRRGDLDLGFVHDDPSEAGLRCHPLREEPLCLAISADRPLAARKRITPRDLDGADWIAVRAGKRERHPNERLLAACAQRGFSPNVRFTVSDRETIVGLVAAGMGLAFLPESAGAWRLAGVTLRHLPWLKMTRGLHVVTRSTGLGPATVAFMACLKEVTA